MTPRRIMDRALKAGLDIVAVSDHNSSENVEVALQTAARMGLAAFAAMEIASSEEVHVLSVFGSAGEAASMQELVYENLSPGENDDRLWGSQVVVNERDEVLGFNRRLLIGATRLPVRRLVQEIRARGGLAIASHVDREAFSVISQLGFIPEDLRFDALEVTRPGALGDEYPGIPRVGFSDAHRLEDVGRRRTSFFMEGASLQEMALALRGAGGRRVAVE
jgi:hypothetical protein